MVDSAQSELIAEQLKHAVDLMRFEINTIKAEQAHLRELNEHHLSDLEQSASDHEGRIRLIQDEVTRSKTLHGLAAGGSTFMSLVALLKTFFGV